MGMERLLLLLEKQGIQMDVPPVCDLYIAGISDDARIKAFELTEVIRNSSLIAECDIVGRKLKPQMKYADKIGAKFSMVLGDDDLAVNKGKLKTMATGKIHEIPLDDNFYDAFIKVYLNAENEIYLQKLGIDEENM